MDKKTAAEMFLWMNPLLALVNYVSFVLVIYFSVAAYREREWVDAATAVIYILFLRYCVVALLRWRARKKLESIPSE